LGIKVVSKNMGHFLSPSVEKPYQIYGADPPSFGLKVRDEDSAETTLASVDQNLLSGHVGQLQAGKSSG